MKVIFFPAVLLLSGCSFGPLAAPTPTGTPTSTPTQTPSATRSPTSTRTSAPTSTPTAALTPTPANLPTHAEGETFAVGSWKLRVIARRAWKVHPNFIQDFEFDCQSDQRVCMVIRVYIVSGVVSFAELDTWSLAVRDDAGNTEEELTRLNVGYAVSQASSGIWVFEVNPQSKFYTIRVLDHLVVAPNSPISNWITFP